MTRKLYASLRSPFARKIRILLLEKGLPFDLVPVDLTARSAEFSAVSPLGKVPVLVEEDGMVVFDSSVIAEYLEDRYPTPSMLGSDVKTRLYHRELDELADTIAEQAVTLFFAQNHAQAALDKANRVLELALDEVGRRLDQGLLPPTFGLGHAAVLSALAYLELRHGRSRLDARPELARWAASFADRESLKATPPPA